MAKKHTVILLHFADDYYLMVNEADAVWGFRSVAEARAYFEGAYTQAHGRSYEASMSACVHYIFFAPRVVRLTMAQIEELARFEDGSVELHDLRCEAGWAAGFKCRGAAKVLYDAGEPPSLLGEAL